MCGRYTLVPTEHFATRFAVESLPDDLEPRYNIAPTQSIPVITRNSPNRVELMRWGLIPSWAKDASIGNKMINARAETVAEKPSFKRALAARRCLVPCSGFYEWRRDDKSKVPYFIFVRNTELFSFAGLYELWKNPSGNLVRSYTIITTTPNKLMENIHNRMPVILRPEDEDVWLDAESDMAHVLSLLEPFPADQMDCYAVSTAVNSPRYEGPSLIEPVQQDGMQAMF
jgi:putative SOS response-associated peptidase YedK